MRSTLLTNSTHSPNESQDVNQVLKVMKSLSSPATFSGAPRRFPGSLPPGAGHPQPGEPPDKPFTFPLAI